MRKSPLIAAGVEGIIGLVMIIVGAIFYNEAVIDWPEWVMWFGIVFVGLAMIILVVAFIKKPGESDEKAQTAETT